MTGGFDGFLIGEMKKQNVLVPIIATVPNPVDPNKPETCDATKSMYTMTGMWFLRASHSVLAQLLASESISVTRFKPPSNSFGTATTLLCGPETLTVARLKRLPSTS